MDKPTTLQIVRKTTIQFSYIGLILAALEFSFFAGFKPLFDFVWYFFLNLIIALAGLYGTIYYFSAAGSRLIDKRILNPYVYGILVTLLSLIIAMFCGSVLSYLEEGINTPHGFRDYIFAPLFAVTAWGSIPALIIGLLLGAFIKQTISENKR